MGINTFDDYELIDRVADALVEVFGLRGEDARWFGNRLAKSLGLTTEYQWLPITYSGELLSQVSSYHEVNLMMERDPSILKIEREYRFVSRWFNPSRGD